MNIPKKVLALWQSLHQAIKKTPIPEIPRGLVWAQCFIFVGLYSTWAIYELLYLRRILLITGATISLYPIYQYRIYLLQKSAVPFWFLLALFIWVIIHLFFFTQDFQAQLLEIRRIWKYAGLGAVFGLGLGISLASLTIKERGRYWAFLYFGMCGPVLIYLLKYVLTNFGTSWGIVVPPYLRINFDGNSAYYIPKTDYIAFCLPVLAISLGQVLKTLSVNSLQRLQGLFAVPIYLLSITGTLFLFSIQNTKNGIAYAGLLITLFWVLVMARATSIKFWVKSLLLIIILTTISGFLYSHIQKNDSWKTLIADTKVGFDLERHPQWKFAGEKGYPLNEFGIEVSSTNYLRASWFKVGMGLAVENPLGFGLVEDSFGRLAKNKWPESLSLSHSHSGWLDLILGVGLPGFLCILIALLTNIFQSQSIPQLWRSIVFWALIANLILWITTEVAATTSFSVLIFWLALSSGLTLSYKSQNDLEKTRMRWGINES